MTQSAIRTVDLPEPGYPMVVNVFTDNLIPNNPNNNDSSKPNFIRIDPKAKDDVVHWAVSGDHPFIPGMRIMRMFIVDNTVEVYSMMGDGVTCMRDTIPMSRVRLTQEGMPGKVFVEELHNAEAADDETDDEFGPDDTEPEETHANAPTSNGQSAS